MTGSPRKDAFVLGYIQRKTREFVDHLREAYPDDERTKALVAKFADVQLLPYRHGNTPESYTSGMFDHARGILKIAPQDGYGVRRSTESLNKSIVHELAHGTRFKHINETSHSLEWKDAWKFFLVVATEELGWKVEQNCSSVSYYDLKREDCPKCDWEIDPIACTKKERLA